MRITRFTSKKPLMHPIPSEIRLADLQKWFHKQGFVQAAFEKGRVHISSYWQGESVSFKLTRREGFDTFYKSAYGGSLLVFEVSNQAENRGYDCYCPIWLFGIWTIKLPFKQGAGGAFRYRKEGYQLHEKFKRYLEK